jgi:hypothetical protein
MTDLTRLHFGPYRAPRFKYGDVVMDEARGEVVIRGLSAARIPWPVGKRGSAKSPVVYAGLAEAVRKESNLAVCYWFGVTPQTVSKWRKLLGVGPMTEGTRRAKQAATVRDPEIVARRAAAATATANDPQRCAKIAAARRGKKRPAHIAAAMRKLRLGKPHTAEARAKMSAAQKARGTWPPAAGRPWTPEEDELVRQLPTVEAAQRTGRHLRTVQRRRKFLHEQAGRKTVGPDAQGRPGR